MTEESRKVPANPLIQEVTQRLTTAGYQVLGSGRTLDDDFYLLVTDPKSVYQGRCLVAFWPDTCAWPLAVLRGDQLYNTGDSPGEIVEVVKRCLADQERK
jgi:hypothetical protein